MTEPSPAWGPSRIHITRYVVLPSALVVLTSAVAVLAVLYFSAREMDRMEIAGEVHAIGANLADRQRNIGRFVKDYAWWDQAFDHLVARRDPKFADNNIGSAAFRSLDMASAFVVDGSDRTLHGYIDGKAVRGNPAELFVGGIEKLIARAREAPPEIPVPAVGYIALGDAIHIVAVAVFVPEKLSRRKPESGPRSVLIYSRVMDSAFLSAIETDYGLSGLKIALPGSPVPDAHIALISPDGTPIGTLAWPPDRPGHRILTAVLPGVLAIFFALAITQWFLLRRSDRMQRQIAKVADILAEKNAALESNERALQMANERIEHASRSKSEFIAILSHETRTPLNAVVGFSEILEAELYGPLGDARYKEYSSHILRSGRHLLELIDDTLDLSRAEIGAVDLDQMWWTLQRRSRPPRTYCRAKPRRLPSPSLCAPIPRCRTCAVTSGGCVRWFSTYCQMPSSLRRRVAG
ncbi:MAG: histidine kinase dimerization/phospho-acceptor domain-containing protein [Alphaproteobacteria bacterium]